MPRDHRAPAFCGRLPGLMRPSRAGRIVPGTLAVLCTALLGASAAGCGARADAAVAPEIPPLAMPLPPPREFAPPVEEPVAAVPADATAGLDVAPPTLPKPTPRRAADPAPRPEPAASAATGAASPPADPPRELRAGDVADRKKIEDLLVRANRDLTTVERSLARLSPNNREHFNNARSFAANAEKALKDGNLVLANINADKAAQIAAELLTALPR